MPQPRAGVPWTLFCMTSCPGSCFHVDANCPADLKRVHVLCLQGLLVREFGFQSMSAHGLIAKSHIGKGAWLSGSVEVQEIQIHIMESYLFMKGFP